MTKIPPKKDQNNPKTYKMTKIPLEPKKWPKYPPKSKKLPKYPQNKKKTEIPPGKKKGPKIPPKKVTSSMILDIIELRKIIYVTDTN